MAPVERLAYRFRRDGTRGWRARRAWRVLNSAAERGDEHAIEVIWQGWLRDPTDDGWELVSRWRTPADLYTAVPGRPAAAREVIGSFCLRHDLLPDNDNDRALFFVLTGRRERYEALDPDGTLLAAAYRVASEATREVLRHSMTALGELAAVRVITDRPERVLAGAEADYVARQLAGAGEWERLRRLVPTMPLTDAMRAARLCPAGEPFLTQLARADPDAVAAVTAAAVTRLRLGRPGEVSIAPDNSEIVVKSPFGLSLFTVPGGELVAEVPDECREVLALGDSTFLYLHTALHAVSRGVESTSTSVHRRTVGRARETLLTDYAGNPRLGGMPDGFVVESRGTLRFGTTHGPWAGEVSVEHDLLATEPTTGQLAFGGKGGLVLTDAGLDPLASTQHDFRVARFCGPDRIITINHAGDLESWQRDGTDLACTATTSIAKSRGLALAPAYDRVLIVAGEVVWLDAGTLTSVSRPDGVPPKALWFSPDGSLAVVHHEDGVDVHDVRLGRLAELAARPLSAATPADLRTLGALANLPPPAGELVELLRTGLEHRFGADVALGTWVAGGADDIALGGG